MVPPFLFGCLLIFWAAVYLLIIHLFRFEPPEGYPVMAFRMPPQPLYLGYLRKLIAFCRREDIILEATITTREGGHGVADAEARGLWTEEMYEEVAGLLEGCPLEEQAWPSASDLHPRAQGPPRPRVRVSLHRQEPPWFVDLFVLCLAEGIEFTGTYDTDPRAQPGWGIWTDSLEPRQLKRVMRAIRTKKTKNK